MKTSYFKLSIVIVFFTMFSAAGFSQSSLGAPTPGSDPLSLSEVPADVAKVQNTTSLPNDASWNNDHQNILAVQKADAKEGDTFNFKPVSISSTEKVQTAMIYPITAGK